MIDFGSKTKPKKRWLKIGDIFESKKLPLKFSDLVSEHKIRTAWDEIVGDVLAKKTQPFRLYKNVLVVDVTSSVLSNQLHFLKDDIMKKLNGAVGREIVSDLKFNVRDFVKRIY